MQAADYFVTKTGSVPRLTHTNFAAWSNAIKYVLIGTDCWTIVNGEEVAPLDVDHYKEFSKRANRAVSLIYGSITPALQAYVGGITDAALMWTKLCATMDIVQNESGSTFMHDKFHHESFLPQDTIDQYISRILTYQERLANIRQKLSDDDVITKLLTALPPPII